MMAAGFERDIERAAPGRLTRTIKRKRLGVWIAELLMPGLGDDRAAGGSVGHDSSHHRIGLDESLTATRKLEGPPHRAAIER